MNNYEAKRQARIDRLKRAITLCKAEAARAHDAALNMADVIPFGQPILIGHHSERRDRAYRARIHRRFERSFELMKKAEEYERRLEAAESNSSISSDDPNAIGALREKLARLELLQTQYKTINKIVKGKKGTREEKQAALVAAFPGTAPDKLAQLFEPDFCGRVGVADYQLTNNNANIRRIKQRIAELERRAEAKTSERSFSCGVRVVDNVEDNRLQMFFPGKPEEAIRDLLKGHGFRWSPYAGCWQRMRGNGAVWAAELVIQSINK